MLILKFNFYNTFGWLLLVTVLYKIYIIIIIIIIIIIMLVLVLLDVLL